MNINKYLSNFITSESRESYLLLKRYSDDDWRLISGTRKKKGYELIQKTISLLEIEDTINDSSDSERVALSRAKKEVIEISRCNDFKYFVTLTINEKNCDRFSLEKSQNLLRKLLKEYQRRCKRNNIEFKYLIVTEKHEKGGFHFHGLFTNFLSDDIIYNNNNYPTSKFFNDNLGFFSFSPIKNRLRCSFYISKYMTKSPIKSETNQLYFCSKGLARAEVFDLPQSASDFTLLKDFWTYSNDYVKIRDFSFSDLEKKYQLFLLSKKEK